MSHGPDYEKAMRAFMADGADNANAAMRPVAETQARLSKIALAATKDGIAASQSWTNEVIAAFEPLANPAVTPAELAAASIEFARSQMQAAPKHVAAFADIAKAAHKATLDVMLDAGRAGMAAVSTTATPTTETAATEAPTTETAAPMTAAPAGKAQEATLKKATVKNATVKKATVKKATGKKAGTQPKAAKPAKAAAVETETCAPTGER
jgi:thiol:disulfide interchange protein